jgi:hypothetical protein
MDVYGPGIHRRNGTFYLENFKGGDQQGYKGEM